ncbi:type II secretion system protein [Limnohabitans sp. 2KL-3]|uniref:type II secretion system protein n=1 Tax=Limnohabitans sp. 2KL-3 TaxID=1100700 RepID=UPI000AD644E0|nr:type II secretion system protein [Limnohabitans sp. 2KL-3]
MSRPLKPAVRGFLLIELALALMVIGGLAAMLIPLLAMQGKLDSARQDALSMQQARDALVRQAVLGMGLPGPIRFAEADTGGFGSAASHVALSPTLELMALGRPGALPGQLLGVPTVSPWQTAYAYDVQPALRDDAATAFYPAVEQVGANWVFKSIMSQLDPAVNTNMSTGGVRTQLCRHLNTLQDIEQKIRIYPTTTSAEYRRSFINVTLPRIWAKDYESNFVWNSALGYATTSADTVDAVFENSSAAAFVVVRRAPPAQRRLDRQNALFQQVGTTGLDPTLDARGTVFPALAGERGFRVYENPLTPAVDSPTSDANDYDGRVQAVSLGELVDGLRQAGVCTTLPETCKVNQLFVRFANYVSSAPLTGSAQGLTLRWELMNRDPVSDAYTVLQSGDIANGSTSTGVCLDSFNTAVTSEPRSRYLRVSFISPTGSVGYADGAAAGYWYRGGLLVDPTLTTAATAADDGVTRWRNLNALAAATAGQTVTVSCSGTHTLLASNEFNRAGAAKPTCTVTQLP